MPRVIPFLGFRQRNESYWDAAKRIVGHNGIVLNGSEARAKPGTLGGPCLGIIADFTAKFVYVYAPVEEDYSI